MNLDEIEDEYKLKTDKFGEEFLNKIKSTKDRARLEAEYKEKLKKAREEYYSKVNNYVEFLKKQKAKQKEFRIKPTKKYEVDDSPLKITRWQAAKNYWGLKLFKIKMKLKRIFEAIYYPHISFVVKLTKIKIKLALGAIKRAVASFVRAIKKSAKKLWESITGGFSAFVSVLKKLKPKKKEKAKKEEKTEGGAAGDEENKESGEKSEAGVGEDAAKADEKSGPNDKESETSEGESGGEKKEEDAGGEEKNEKETK